MEWTERDQALHADIRTKDFASALVVVNSIGALAEEAQHHPDLEFGWGYVRITLASHDKGQVTDRDRRLAAAIDQIPLP